MLDQPVRERCNPDFSEQRSESGVDIGSLISIGVE